MWLVLSGHYDVMHLGLGAVSVVLVLVLSGDLRREEAPLRGQRLRVGRFLAYLPWLAMEMVLSAWQVAKVVLSRSMPMNPSLVRFRSDQPNDLAKVILGNSITLTPGTLTVDIEGDEFLVHHLTDASRDDLLEGRMATRVAGLFGPASGRMIHEVRREPLE